MNEFFRNMFSFIDVGGWFDAGIEWLTDNVSWLFDGIRAVLDATLTGFETALSWPYPLIVIAVLVAIAYFAAHKGVAIFTVVGFLLIVQMETHLI